MNVLTKCITTGISKTTIPIIQFVPGRVIVKLFVVVREKILLFGSLYRYTVVE